MNVIKMEHTDAWWNIFWEGKKEAIEWAENRNVEEIQRQIEKMERDFKERTPSAREEGFLEGLKSLKGA